MKNLQQFLWNLTKGRSKELEIRTIIENYMPKHCISGRNLAISIGKSKIVKDPRKPRRFQILIGNLPSYNNLKRTRCHQLCKDLSSTTISPSSPTATTSGTMHSLHSSFAISNNPLFWIIHSVRPSQPPSFIAKIQPNSWQIPRRKLRSQVLWKI